MQENNLSLNINKTKTMIVDFKKKQKGAPPIHIEVTAVEKVESFKFLGIHITDKLKWSTHTDSMSEEGAKAPLQPQEAEEIWLVTQNPDKLLQMHNREHSVGLYHSLVRQLHRPQLQGSPEGGVVCTTHHWGKLPALHDTYSTRCHRKAEMIIKEINHTSHCLFTPLPLEGDVSTGASKLGPRD